MEKIITIEDFNNTTNAFWAKNEKPYAFGIGLHIYDSEFNIIAVKWLTINIENNHGTAAILMNSPKMTASTIVEMCFEPFLADGKHHENIAALRFIGDDIPAFKVYQTKEDLTQTDPSDICDVHFRHALISRRHFQPNTLNLNGHFGILPNLVWTAKHAYTLDDYNKSWYIIHEDEGMPICHDKFPPMYWSNPALSGVRVANTSMVRNGAHLAEETTVMHYGFINFNAGTLGKAMVEGRIAGGVTIDHGTDVGAGAGFLGTMSGGNDRVLSTGKSNLVGAMAEVGIILGDGNQVAAGVTILANTKVYDVRDETWKVGTDFDKCNNTLFLSNTKEGRMEARDVKKPVELNDELHDN